MPTGTPLFHLVLLAAFAATPTLALGAPVDRYDSALAWAQCIRDNGYTNFPDPDAEGGFQFLVDRDKGELFRAATDACRALAPEGMRDDAVAPAQLDALVRLAQCIRENGMPGFPDPGAGGNFDLSGLGIKPGDTGLEAAMSTCQAEGAAPDIRITIGG